MTDSYHDTDDLDAAVAAMKQLSVPDLRPADDAVLAQLVIEPSRPVFSIPQRRWFMRFATCSLAASVLIAGAFVLFGDLSRVALADVVKAAEMHMLVKYKMVSVSEQDEEPKTGTSESICYADLKTPRFRSDTKTTSINGALECHSWTVQDNAKNRILSVISETVTEAGRTDPKLAKLLESVAAQGGPRKVATLSAAPDFPGTDKKQTFLDNLREFESNQDAKAESTVENGRKILKYEVEEGARTTALWVDAETKLPIKMVVEMIITDAKATKTTITFSDFEWDPHPKEFKNLDELFSVTPPDGHKLDDQTKK